MPEASYSNTPDAVTALRQRTKELFPNDPRPTPNFGQVDTNPQLMELFKLQVCAALERGNSSLCGVFDFLRGSAKGDARTGRIIWKQGGDGLPHWRGLGTSITFREKMKEWGVDFPLSPDLQFLQSPSKQSPQPDPDPQPQSGPNATAQAPTRPRSWWLTASPRIWDFSALAVGATQDYTALNANGNKRRIYQNFADARIGDTIFGYVAQPQKKLVALCTITDKDAGHNITFRKDEHLATPLSYAELQDVPELRGMQFFQNPNGSLFALSEEEAAALLDYVRERNPLASTRALATYTDADFLAEVFVSEAEYTRLRRLLTNRKNVILHGPPGVGKTFAARRLAWALMGEKDDKRITMVQFHQSYAYEDFIMGYRPDGTGFALREGVFHQACVRAANDPERPHVFIIDEINRGNLSRIFGEVLMLLERDYRGREHSVQLPCNDERFFIPENLHVIGMMNTADRSLALMDYALRRRFAFFAMAPAFANERFTASLGAALELPQLPRLLNAVAALNTAITDAPSLGRGYCLGHSYFCGLGDKAPADLPRCLEDIVECDLIPTLEEYWFDDGEKLHDWADRLRQALRVRE